MVQIRTKNNFESFLPCNFKSYTLRLCLHQIDAAPAPQHKYNITQIKCSVPAFQINFCLKFATICRSKSVMLKGTVQ
jgi:hypothetical protein